MHNCFTFVRRALRVALVLLLTEAGVSTAQAQPQGAVNGFFSVGANSPVRISKGNLQFIGSASPRYWKFADHQWDCIGANAQSNGSSNSNRDLFGWAMSGLNHGGPCYDPWTITTNNYDYLPYGNPEANLYDGNGKADWGYNAILNGGNQTNSGWRTPTHQEWSYLLNERNTASGIRFALATVNQTCGLLLLPDDWNPNYYALNNTNEVDVGYSVNVLSSSAFASLEQHGVVFLPAAGYRHGSEVRSVGDEGWYWTSSSHYDNAYYMKFKGYNNIGTGITESYLGLSVRLVRNAFNITCMSNPAVGGTVSGGGTVDAGAQCTVTATPAAGYTFLNWTDDGEVVSTNPTYSFTVTRNINLMANFISSGVVINQGLLPGAFSVSDGICVCFSQGNLQYIGQASTPYWKFAEHQWDFLGKQTQDGFSQTLNRDLFGWGTSGYNHGAVCYQPWSTSYENSDYAAYGNPDLNLFDGNGQADWGYNAILNGGNQEHRGWRTLTGEEWDYLFNSRSTPSGIRFAKAMIDGINGVILLPDDWDVGTFALNGTNGLYEHYSVNELTANQWVTLEQAGAVFLPATGYRFWIGCSYVGDCGYYWSSSNIENGFSYCWLFSNGLVPGYSAPKCHGCAVRLVRPFLKVSASTNPSEGGTTSGGGLFDLNQTCTVSATASSGYEFVDWTENGEVVSTNPTYTFTVTRGRNLVANFITPNSSSTQGALNGAFSVSDNTRVNFSQGNLQYIGSASTPYWKFAEHQWDYLGNNGQGSDSPTANRDLFGWGTSGYNHGAICYQPWSTSTVRADYFAYGDPEANLFDGNGQADWGYNAILNGGNTENSGWRTLTSAEWVYLLTDRNTPSGMLFAKAVVNGVNGVILLPDNWNAGTFALNNTNDFGMQFNSNTLTATQWSVLEQAGAVFLPAAGRRNGTTVSNLDVFGVYCTASSFDSQASLALSYGNNTFSLAPHYPRYYGISVRLVCPASGVSSFNINATPNPASGGTVSGAGSYEEGFQCTLTATPNVGYAFVNWTENNQVVSTSPTYSFMVTGDRTLVANFQNYTVPATEGVLGGNFSVSANTQVNFSQGNLQYIGSANTPYWKFAEFQWTFLGDNGQGSAAANVDRDLFGWGTSGYNHGAVCYQPWSTSDYYPYYYAYGDPDANLFDGNGQADWGYNAISNGGNQENSGWRTLTSEEWTYLFDTRNTPSGIRFVTARVNGVNGFILLPDDWDANAYSFVNPNDKESNYENNDLSLVTFAPLEQMGAVFLPVACQRDGTTYFDGQTMYYWSSSCSGGMLSLAIHQGDSYNAGRSDGYSVRLVRNTQGGSSFNINATPNPANGGTVSGAGSYEAGTECTLTATANPGYIFVNWTENGQNVSTSATYTFTVTGNRTLVANFLYYTVPATEGVLGGNFSVSANTQVNFSQGNLQYIGSASTSYWKFAELQWEYLGNNGQETDSQTLDRDLFGWGTSGYNHGAVCYQPWSTNNNSQDYCPYGDPEANLFDGNGQADWGYNAISNGGNTENSGWRTLTCDEWDCLFNTRNTPSGIRYAKATINGVVGVILLPDDWDVGTFDLNNANNPNANFNTNTLTVSQWVLLEQAGAVFLPAAGRRLGSGLLDVGGSCYYWSATTRGNYYANLVNAWAGNIGITNGYGYSFGLSVRLVRPVVITYYEINAIPNPANGGTVSGASTYVEGTECTLTATANTGYTFVNWTENNQVVSTNVTYTFTVTGNRALVANFQVNTYNVTVAANPTIAGTVTGAGSYTHGTSVTVTATPALGYEFVNWTENDQVVSPHANYTFDVTGNRNLVANFVEGEIVHPEGTLNGVFSVSEEEQVFFSQGNLQYIGSAATPYWKFADHQWDYLGTTTNQNSDATDVDRDLFGWGTSGFDHGSVCYQPWSTSSDYKDYKVYGSNDANLYDQNGQADWGYNAISNGGNRQNDGWRTLTRDEWVYLFNTRSTPSGIRFAKAVVNEVSGVILLPDNWSADHYALNGTNAANANYTANQITYTQWATLDAHGAVFLPAAGFRDGVSYNTTQTPGFYWSSTRYGAKNAKILNFYSYGCTADAASQTNFGRSVRLVRSIHANTSAIDLSFTAGWNWFSSYVQYDENSLADLQSQLDDLGVVALIKSQNAFVSNESGYWAGSLDSLDNTMTYMIRLDQGVTVTLNGAMVVPSEQPITLRPGWNWIGFYFEEPMSLEEFLSGFTPQDGDIIKSQNAFSSYSTSLGWSGNLNTLEPGKGYLFLNNGNTNRVLIFP